ncbi:MAG: hypothetical protein HDS39_04175 [Bacteroides sp.]|nr:hypothetical protein [Bacteroides sp.]
MKKSNMSSSISVKLGKGSDSLKNAIQKGIKLQAISSSERERLRIPSYEYILP